MKGKRLPLLGSRFNCHLCFAYTYFCIPQNIYNSKDNYCQSRVRHVIDTHSTAATKYRKLRVFEASARKL